MYSLLQKQKSPKKTANLLATTTTTTTTTTGLFAFPSVIYIYIIEYIAPYYIFYKFKSKEAGN